MVVAAMSRAIYFFHGWWDFVLSSLLHCFIPPNLLLLYRIISISPLLVVSQYARGRRVVNV